MTSQGEDQTGGGNARDGNARDGDRPGQGETGDHWADSGSQQVLAVQLHVTDRVQHAGVVHTVTSLRIQGAPAEVCVEFAGLPGRSHFPPTAPVTVLTRRHRTTGEG